MIYGPWLRVELKQFSPYWDAFYHPKVESMEETVLETPPQMQPALLALPPIPATEVVTSNLVLPQGTSKQLHPVTSTAITTDLVLNSS